VESVLKRNYLKYKYLPEFWLLTILRPKGIVLLGILPIDPKIMCMIWSLKFFGDIREPWNKPWKMELIPPNVEEAESQWGTDRVQLGTYDDIFYDAKEGFIISELFARGNGAQICCLQFIRESTCSKDLEVPIRFRVLGSVDGGFFTPMGS